MRISIDSLWKRKLVMNEKGQRHELTILSDVSFVFCGTCIQMILGSSGSGKTTLLRLLNKLESPTQGSIFYEDTNYEKIPARELRKNVGMVFQTPALFRGTIFDNINFGPDLHKKKLTEKDVLRLLNLVGLDKIEFSRDVESLSQGQQQRISFARALANDPHVLLLDEPTSALDPSAAKNLLDLIKKINRETGVSIMMVTHAMEHAQRIADNICLLIDGKIAESGPATAFFNHPETEVGRKFIRGVL